MSASLAFSSALPMAAALDGLTAMPSTFLAIRSLHDLDLLLAAAMLAGADVQALELAAELRFSAFLQPSRAWSKNGLFMFFGTSANVELLRACAGASAGQGAEHRRRSGADQQFPHVLTSLWLTIARPNPLSPSAFRGSAPAEPRE